ncbi:uncharacterized protein LOC133336467, partial [Musca vetustissima]|uniref:uncharacterized protein LOC133336467 n=1 Tax=Musca vetustissima TaxID=27455 RepID=UPI002AB783C1
HGHEPYQFRGAYSPEVQEFIEAYTFIEYIKYVEENDGEGAGGDEGGEMNDWNASMLRPCSLSIPMNIFWVYRKIYTMCQSVLKTENVCYNVKVRGGEAAKWGAMFDSKWIADDIDEGFF